MHTSWYLQIQFPIILLTLELNNHKVKKKIDLIFFSRATTQKPVRLILRTVTSNKEPPHSPLINILIMGSSESQTNSHSSQYSFKNDKKKFSPQIVCKKTDLKIPISCEYKCRICNLIEVIFTVIYNSLFPKLSPHNVFATERQKLPAFQSHHNFYDTFKRGNPVPRGPLISRNTIIPATGMEEESSLILLASTFCLPGALHTSEHSKRASFICISY